MDEDALPWEEGEGGLTEEGPVFSRELREPQTPDDIDFPHAKREVQEPDGKPFNDDDIPW
jgi:hypothetical protein